MQSEKITEVRARRWYRDACGTAAALELVGERWSLLVMRELLLGPRRFNELRRALPGLSANVLAQRLERLEGDGIVTHQLLPSPAGVAVYELTRWGYAADDAIAALGRWAAGSAKHDITLPLSNTAFMLSLRTMMSPAVGSLAGLDVGFRVGGEGFRATVDGDRLAVRRAETAGAPVVFGGDPGALALTFFGPERLVESQALGRVAVAGDLRTAQAFVALFRLSPVADD